MRTLKVGSFLVDFLRGSDSSLKKQSRMLIGYNDGTAEILPEVVNHGPVRGFWVLLLGFGAKWIRNPWAEKSSKSRGRM